MRGRGGTEEIRDELIGVRPEKPCDRRAEIAGLLRSSGTLQLHAGGVLGFEAAHTHAGVARRIHEAANDVLGHPDRTVVEQPGQGHPRPRFVVHVERVSSHRLIEAGILDASGRPSVDLPAGLVTRACCVGAFLRGSFLARGSANAARSGPHLEIRADDEAHAEIVARLIGRLGAKASVRTHHGAAAVVKDERSMVTVLTAMGAYAAALAREDAAIWKGLHADANRLRNADAANAGRQGRAAATQLAAIEELDARIGLDRLPGALRAAAEARRANPDDTLSELADAAGVSRSAMADRLRRLVALAAEEGQTSP